MKLAIKCKGHTFQKRQGFLSALSKVLFSRYCKAELSKIFDSLPFLAKMLTKTNYHKVSGLGWAGNVILKQLCLMKGFLLWGSWGQKRKVLLNKISHCVASYH